jgi:hypothetical protein
VATFKVLNPKAGKFTFTASYPGDEFNLSSSAQAIATVKAEATATLKSSVNPSTSGKAVVFTVKVTSGVGTPTGAVILKKNGTTLATGSLIKGQVSFSITSLVSGTHTIVAGFSGDATHLPSTSNAISEVTK